MSAHRRPPRPYRGGKRRLPVYDFSTPEPQVEHPVGKPGDHDGPGHVVDLAYNPNEARDSRGRWTETAASALAKAIHGDVASLERTVRADQGPSRIKMPQLSGVPIPGSKADQIPHAPGEEVDLTSQFEIELRAKGYTVEDTAVPVRNLKPTQDQLVGAKVAGLAQFMLHAPPDSPVWEPIFVSEDDHVIDGHHRWAARTVKDEIQGHLTDRMDVRKIDVDIETALRLATEFMDEWGLPRQGTSASASPVVSHFASLSNHYDPNQPRDAQGQWTASAANVVSMWNQATPGEKEAGEQWYPLAHQTALALSKKYGVSKEEAAGLLAAYSPQTPWGRDQVEASESLRYGHGVGGKYGAVWFTHDDPTVEDRVGVMATGQTRKLADDIMAGGDFDTLTAGRNKDGSLKPASPKIRAFYHLIAAGGQDDPDNPRVVIDRHAMSVAYGQRVTNDDYTKMRPGSAKKYKPFVDAYVDAAKQISAMEGRTISPETVQAATWLAQQRQNAAMTNQVGKTRKALGNKDWDEWTKYAARYLGLDTAGGAKVGYSDLAKVMRDEIIDLAFDPNQPRDRMGRWTDTGISNAWIQGRGEFRKIREGDPEYAVPFADMLSRQPDASGLLYRGTTRDVSQMKVGDVLHWNAPRSTTAAISTAVRFGEKHNLLGHVKGEPTLYQIETRAGKVLPGQDRLGTMHEAVVPPGSYRVKHIGKVRLPGGGSRMTALHPDAPEVATLITLEDITQGARSFVRQKPKHLLDLAFDPNQPRDLKGRWTDVPGVGKVLDATKHANMKMAYTPDGDTVYVPSTAEMEDGREQYQAQTTAQGWRDYVVGDTDRINTAEEKAAVLWGAYQNPDDYGAINKTLRGMQSTADITDGAHTLPGVPAAEVKKMAHDMFMGRGSTVTAEDMTVYRALRSKDRDWATLLTPGAEFTEDGIVSTTAYRRLAQGWIGLDGKSNAERAKEDVKSINPDSAVLEIRYPAGNRIIGGVTQFIETMLPPGTKFKVVSSEKVRTSDGANPMGGERLEPFTYTHIVVEATPPEWARGK